MSEAIDLTEGEGDDDLHNNEYDDDIADDGDRDGDD